MKLNKTYLRQMRFYKRLASWADRHERAVNFLTVIEATAFAWYVFWYI